MSDKPISKGRRRTLKLALGGAVALPSADILLRSPAGAVLTGATFSMADQVAAASRPNIVVIMTDDQRRISDMDVLQKTRKMIGNNATRFEKYYCPYPLCAPSRSSFLTGQYAHNHGVMDNSPPTGGYGKLNDNNTLPVWLQNAGYHTCHVGKYING